VTPAQGAALGGAQGVAEVVPVSSSAQLVLLPWLLRWEEPADRTAFAAGLHAGSCAGITWALRRELWQLDRRTALQVAAGSVPAALAGLLAADAVEQRLGRPPQLAALLAGAGALLWWADARAERHADHPAEQHADRPADHADHPDDLTAARPLTDREAAYAALAQVTALVPGVSRSGATLTALRLAGVDRASAQRFTLLLSLPVTAGAALLTLWRADRSVARAVAPGAVTAALAGATTVTRLTHGRTTPLRAAAVYRLGLAAVVARRLRREGEL
jgi:undecaprenyl-diphosphatase